MKKAMILNLVAFLCFLVGVAFAQDDIKKYLSCNFCGMDRDKYAHSRVYTEYNDGTTVGTCSIHCAAIDLAINIDKTPEVISVGDYNTKNLINVDKAYWVIGGSKTGIMTKKAKWAFEKKENAEKFIKENGGKLASFDEVIKASYEDMYGDTKMIREKRKMMKMEHKH